MHKWVIDKGPGQNMAIVCREKRSLDACCTQINTQECQHVCAPSGFTRRKCPLTSVGARAVNPPHAWHPQGPIRPTPHPVPLHYRSPRPCPTRVPTARSSGGAVPRDVVARGG